ncbi:hypothetical protein [Gordonia rubripertincta]|uniref:Uncharacterized protein n=1 Tax=Gordonia rubripertincta TaxID=36822 RepID=A0ABT4MVE7_GORRU|nr:hypothetical protein [Gordonia rubripertincta]MCZ4550246.1 hypothetical protein [Gordonia rubripertincta]
MVGNERNRHHTQGPTRRVRPHPGERPITNNLTPAYIEPPDDNGWIATDWFCQTAHGPDFDLDVIVTSASFVMDDRIDGPVVIVNRENVRRNVDEIRNVRQLNALIGALLDAQATWMRLEVPATEA